MERGREGGGFVSHLKARDTSSVLGGLALGIVEVGGDSDNGLVHAASEVGICKMFEQVQRRRQSPDRLVPFGALPS